MDYKEKLKQRQTQEYADKGKTGLGRIDILDFSKANRIINSFTPRVERAVENVFDILPFRISQPWYKDLRAMSGRPIGFVDVGDLDYKLQVPIHRGMGATGGDTYLCLREAFGKECERCKDMFDHYRVGDKEAAGKLRPTWFTFYDVYDYNDPDRGYQLFKIAYYNFEAASSVAPSRANLIDAANIDVKGQIIFSDLQDGKTIIAKFIEKILGKNKFPEVFDIRFEDRDPYDESVLDLVLPLDAMLIIPTVDQVKMAHLGISEENNGEENGLPTGIQSEAKEQTRTKAEQPRRQRPTIVKSEPDKKPESKCPVGEQWGVDCNKFEACSGAERGGCSEKDYNLCFEEQERLNNAVQPEPEPEPDPPSPASAAVGRRRSRR